MPITFIIIVYRKDGRLVRAVSESQERNISSIVESYRQNPDGLTDNIRVFRIDEEIDMTIAYPDYFGGCDDPSC